ncbi:MAG TPA: hypothetical protein VJ915_10150 [Balneolaceae bacterium]|nr:hypothetical protein [Balneolaceae bacterium]
MAELNQNNTALSFAAAVTAMSLGTGKRLIRNFSYYKQTRSETISRQLCLDICSELRFNVFSLQNLYLDDTPSDSHGSFKVLIAKQIQDNLEELHRKVLFFEPDDIIEIVSALDSLRAFWSESSDPGFYQDDLSLHIDKQIVPLLSDIQKHLKKLPEETNS